MSLRLVSSLTRIASPVVRRNPNSAVIGQAFSMSSNTSENPPKPPKAAVKVRHQTPEVSPGSVEKGDTYKAGETYFSFNPYSFYDFEKEMQPKRLEQPCSGDKMKIYCRDKLNPTDEHQRRLLPEEFGYLVEWPGKEQLMNKKYAERPVLPVIERKYQGFLWNKQFDPYCKTRMPL